MRRAVRYMLLLTFWMPILPSYCGSNSTAAEVGGVSNLSVRYMSGIEPHAIGMDQTWPSDCTPG